MQKMKNKNIKDLTVLKTVAWRFVVITLILGTVASKDLASAQAEPVNVHIPSFDISVIPLYVAQANGYFKEQGLEPSMILASPSVGINGLLSGNFHFSASAGSASTAIARNLPLKIVFVNTFKPTFWIYAGQNIKSPGELKGKKLAVSSIGGLSHTLAKLALSKSGLNPDRDVVMIAAGTGETRLAALKSGAVDAAVLNAPGKFKAKMDGLKEVLFIGEHVDSLSGGVVTTNKMIETRPETVERFVIAAAKGLKYFLSNRSGSVAITMKTTKVDAEMAKEVYEMSLPTFTKAGSVTEEFMKNEAELQAGVLRLKAVPPYDRPFDMSFALKASQRIGNWKPQ
jgi:NitT/TauT family transport system substrate-binding protein